MWNWTPNGSSVDLPQTKLDGCVGKSEVLEFSHLHWFVWMKHSISGPPLSLPIWTPAHKGRLPEGCRRIRLPPNCVCGGRTTEERERRSSQAFRQWFHLSKESHIPAPFKGLVYKCYWWTDSSHLVAAREPRFKQWSLRGFLFQAAIRGSPRKHKLYKAVSLPHVLSCSSCREHPW